MGLQQWQGDPLLTRHSDPTDQHAARWFFLNSGSGAAARTDSGVASVGHTLPSRLAIELWQILIFSGC
jgi:hypothetical protein